MLLRILRRLRRHLSTRGAYRLVLRDWTSLGDLHLCARVLETMRFMRNVVPEVVDELPGRRILVISPHPDDIMIGPGGALIRSVDQGKQVVGLFLTTGRQERTELLERETEAAARLVGFEPEYLRFEPGRIPVDRTAQEAFSEPIRRFDPDLLMLPFLLDDNDDHRRANELMFRTEQSGLLQSVPEVWAYQVYSPILPGAVLDITEEKDRKAEAIRAWASEFEIRDWVHWGLGLNAFNGRFLGRTDGQPYVEAFYPSPLPEYIRFCQAYFGGAQAAPYYSEHYEPG